MFNKKLFTSFLLFSLFMIFTSIVKTQTKLLEKDILKYQKKVALLENNIYEAQLDYSYLTSPGYISNNIKLYSDFDYSTIKFSKIYFSLEQFLEEENKTTKKFANEKKIQKK
tara:strand:+ start:296 stop:631 length:336 start_codon:yes stop_codon:yes gene_type:complete